MTDTCDKSEVWDQRISTVKLAIFIYKAYYTYSTVTGRSGGSQPHGSSRHTPSHQKLLRSKENEIHLSRTRVKVYTHIYKNKITWTEHNWEMTGLPLKWWLLLDSVSDESDQATSSSRMIYILQELFSNARTKRINKVTNLNTAILLGL